LKEANASNTTIQILSSVAWYVDKVLPSVVDAFEFGNVTWAEVLELHLNISNELAPILVANHSDVLRLLGLQPAQTEVLFYYLGYNNETLPLSKALSETLNLPEDQTAFTGQLIKALTTAQTNFSDSPELLDAIGMTPSQFIVARGFIYAVAEIGFEIYQGQQTNATIYPYPGWWNYATLGYRNPEVDFAISDYRPQDIVSDIMGFQKGYNLVGLPYGNAVSDTGLISK
jgi:hypothetical protein